MNDHRITDEQVTALLEGRAPDGREDLQRVADVVGTLRLASFEPPPQPSAALAARLDLDRLAWVSASRGAGVPACDADRTTVLPARPANGKVKKAFGWFTGLGIAAQLALGAGAVSASAAGIGMAGGLPPAAQEMFDAVVATVTQHDVVVRPSTGEPAPAPADDSGTGADGADKEETEPPAAGTPEPADKPTADDADAGPGVANDGGGSRADDRAADQPDNGQRNSGSGGGAADRPATQPKHSPAPEPRQNPGGNEAPAPRGEDADVQNHGTPAPGNRSAPDRDGGSTGGGSGDAADVPAQPTDAVPGAPQTGGE